MGQINRYLRRLSGGYSHWCPGCKEIHKIPDSWIFDGNLESPTFMPSFKHEGCHYTLIAGVLSFHIDCAHVFVGKSVPLPELPEWLRDE